MMLSRSDRSGLSIWLWTIDKWIFFSFLTLLILGIIFILTSSSTLELKLKKIKLQYFFHQQPQVLTNLKVLKKEVNFLKRKY